VNAVSILASFDFLLVNENLALVCGNTIMGNNRPVDASECATGCTGDLNKKCGGQSRLNIYVKNNYQYTTGPPTALDKYKNYKMNQCQMYVFL
jgi:hypothetical protein